MQKQTPQIPPFSILAFSSYYVLFKTRENRFFVMYFFRSGTLRWKGKRISPFLCYRTANICGLKLKRMHFTCLRCHLRRTLQEDLPLIQEITFRQIWFRKNRSTLENVLSKNLLSIVEALS